jgi:hypothetical protein
MKSKLVEFEVGEGAVVLVEIDQTVGAGDLQPVAETNVLGKAAKTFEQTMSSLTPIMNSVVSAMSNITRTPCDVSVEIGFKLSGKGTLIICSSEGEASLKASIKWREPRSAGAG